MKKLKQLREDRGWTIYEVARRAGVSFQSVANLEDSASKTGPGHPAKATITTVNALIELFHPHLALCDFVTKSDLAAVPRDDAALERILAKQST